MKTLTKRQALEDTIKMWTWLAEHPAKSKPAYIRAFRLTDIYANDCPCCEYASHQVNDTLCDGCPLIKRWSISAERCAACTKYDSPYLAWSQASDPVERTKHANAIVVMAKQELAKLPKTKTKTKTV